MRTTSSVERMRRIAILVAVALLPAGLAAAIAFDNEPRNVVAHGDFETVAMNLSLPAVSPFPLVAGGWGGRGGSSETLRVVPDGVRGQRVLELSSAPSEPVHALQDVPLATRSFVLELSVRRLHGRQTLRLLSDWDRLDPEESGTGIDVVLGAGAIRIRTAEGTWPVPASLNSGEWVQIRLVADARTELLEVWLDDVLSASVPGLPAALRTLVMGGSAPRSDSSFRYDSISLYRLAELELAELRRDVLQRVPDRDRPWVLERLDAAAVALERGAPVLAAPEIRAAARLLGRSAAASAPDGGGSLSTDATALLELVAAR